MDDDKIERVAIQLHRDYRAITKALEIDRMHDHGWKACHEKKYFRQRVLRQINAQSAQRVKVVPPECPVCKSRKLQCPNGHTWYIMDMDTWLWTW